MIAKPVTHYSRGIYAAVIIIMGAIFMSTYGWSVSGTVKSSDGVALSGVSVSQKDVPANSTVTDNSGKFKLESSTSIVSSHSINKSCSYSVKAVHGQLIIRSPRDESLKITLVDCSGRTVWTANCVSVAGVAKVNFPHRIGHGAAFLLVHHDGGVEYKTVAPTPDGGISVAAASVTTSAAAAEYPTILFKKTDFADTNFTLTEENMTGVSIVMKSAETRTCPLPSSIKWESTGIVVNIHPDTKHPIVSVKDPTIQKYNGKYLIYSTVYNTKSVNGSSEGWSMQFIQFDDFSKADNATPFFMDQVNGFGGYKCAPELFYFEPKNVWYLLWQQQDPAYSTTTTPDDPTSWSAPKKFYANGLGSIKLPIDYFPIADDKNFYLFFTGDDGNVYRAQTTLADFPNNFSAPKIIKTLATSIIFEGSCHFKVKGTTNTYLHLVEGMGSTGRVYSAWTSEGIEGQWKDYLVGSNTPFAGKNNVTFTGGSSWTNDISHGELIRSNPNQTQEIDPCNLQLLYQGRDPSKNPDYNMLPYRLGLLTAK